MKAISTNTIIDWKLDSLDVIIAKQELEKFLESQTEIKAKYKDEYPRIDAYNKRRISELNAFIVSHVK